VLVGEVVVVVADGAAAAHAVVGLMMSMETRSLDDDGLPRGSGPVMMTIKTAAAAAGDSSDDDAPSPSSRPGAPSSNGKIEGRGRESNYVLTSSDRGLRSG